MIKTFSQYVTENLTPKEVVVTLEHFNPPTAEHEKLIEKTAQIAAGRPYRIYTTRYQNDRNNPIPLVEKVKYVRKMFPRHARAVMGESDAVTNALDVCAKLYEQGFTAVTLVTAEDTAQLSTLLNSMNGKQHAGGFFNFKEGVKVVSAGIPNLGTDGDKLRAAARANDLELFSKGIPTLFQENTKDLFNSIRAGYGLKESNTFRKHIQLESVSDRREAYVAGELFEVGDSVVIKETEEVGKIVSRGANYLVVESNGKKMRKWLNAVELLESKALPVENPVEKPTRQYTGPGRSISEFRNLSKTQK